MFDLLEGTRTFQVIYGLVTGGACLALSIPMLWWYLPKHRRSFFGTAIDPGYGLQLAYGIFVMGMAFTDIGCRAIPHGKLEYVHPTFFFMTLMIVLTVTPRLIAMARQQSPLTRSQSPSPA